MSLLLLFFLGHTIVDLIDKMLAKTPSQAQWQRANKNLQMNFCIVGFYKVFYDSYSLSC
jgi:hypothetical protein